MPLLVQDEYLADTQNLRVADMKQACKAVGLKVSGEFLLSLYEGEPGWAHSPRMACMQS